MAIPSSDSVLIHVLRLPIYHTYFPVSLYMCIFHFRDVPRHGACAENLLLIQIHLWQRIQNFNTYLFDARVEYIGKFAYLGKYSAIQTKAARLYVAKRRD